MSKEQSNTKTNRNRRWLKRLLPVAVLAAGALVAVILVATKPETKTSPPENRGLLVQTVEVQPEQHALDVRAQGSVIPARSIAVHSQVAGKVVEVHPNLAPGGMIGAGETLLQIDPSDYRLAVKQSKTQLEQARAQLALETGRQQVAEEEWQLFKETFNAPGHRSDLALREPQLASTRAQVQRAEAALEQAQLQLSRTRITAPFPVLVVEESADIGQQVQPQQRIARLVGTEEFWIRVAVPPDKIAAIQIPNASGEQGSPVKVTLDIGKTHQEFHGHVLRLEGGLDPRSRMAQLIVSVPDPLGQLSPEAGQQSGEFPLLLDAYVNLVIESPQTLQAIALPREAVRNGNQAFVFANGELRIAELELAWERQQQVLVSGGLQAGDQVIVSNVPAAVEGMKLRREQPTADTETAAKKPQDKAQPQQNKPLAQEGRSE